MNAHQIKAVFFDWDNTLVDTWPSLLYAANTLFDYYKMPHWNMQQLQESAHQSTRESFPKLFGDRWKDAQKIFQQTVRNYSKQHLVLLPGALNTLELLKNHGMTLAIISNKTKELLHEEILQLNVGKYFDIILGSGDAPYDKPAKDMGLIALDQLDLQHESVIYVGDSITDYKFSDNLNIACIMFGENADISCENATALAKAHVKNHEQLSGFFLEKLLNSHQVFN